MSTRVVQLSARKIANEGARYWGQFVGWRVLHTLADGSTRAGVIEEFRNGYPVIRFTDGSWARGDLQVHALFAG